MQLEDGAQDSDDLAGGEPDLETTATEQPGEGEGSQADPTFEPPSTEERNAAEIDRRPTRKESKAERGRVFRENEGMKRELEELRRSNQALADSMRGFQKSLDDSRPKPPTAKEKALTDYRARLRETMASLDANDPKALDRFADLMAEAGRIGSMDLIDERVNEVRGSIPQPKSPHVARLEAEFPWLDQRKQEVNLYMRRLAETKYKGKNLDDHSLLYAVAREAAAMVARDWELPVESPRDTSGPRRLAGSSGRSSGSSGGAGGGPGFDAETLAKIDAAASVMFSAPGMTAEQRRTKWLATMAKNQPDAYRRIVGG